MYKELDIDPAEFACLKAIILFKPGSDKLDSIGIEDNNNTICLEVNGLKDRKEIENLQDQSLSMLQHQVWYTSKGNSYLEYQHFCVVR